MPQIIGSGAAMFDFNNDGRLDILSAPKRRPELVFKEQTLSAAC